MKEKKIRIGVVGLGRIGWDFHALNLAKHPDYELVAVADPEAERRAQAEKELGCRAHASFDTLLQEQLDAVVIATPTHLHLPMALRAFDQKLHVILEKPMALDLAEGEKIAAAAERAGCKLTIYQPHRLAAYFQQLLQIIGSGKIGQVYWARCGMFNFARRNDWQAFRKYGGGMLSNYGAHAVDQLMGIIGRDITRVFCDLQRVATMGDADDVVKIVLETAKGTLGEIDISMAAALTPSRLMVFGTSGAIALKQTPTGEQFEVRWFDPARLPDKKLNEYLASTDRRYPADDIPFIEELIPLDGTLAINLFSDFAAAIHHNRPPAVPPADTLAVMKIIDLCRANSGDVADFTPQRNT